MNEPKKKPKIHVLYKNGVEIARGTIKEITAQTGISDGLLYRYKKSNYKGKQRRVAVNLGDGEFALYQGDELIAQGPLKDVAATVGVKPATIRFYSTPTTQIRSGGNDWHKFLKTNYA